MQALHPSVTTEPPVVTRGVCMTDITVNSALGEGAPIQPAARPNLDKGFNPLTLILFLGILAAGLLFVAYSIYADVEATGAKVTTYLPYILLFVALLIALGFEFVNADTVGASWRTHYDRLHLHTVRWLSHLPGLRIPRENGRWVHRDDVIAYLERYAAYHELDLMLGTEVRGLARSADGGWSLETSNGNVEAGAVV